MYIVQMADLHIGSTVETTPKEKEFLKKSIELIKEKVPVGSTLLLCLCGDIIDSKGLAGDGPEAAKRYDDAADLIRYYKGLLMDVPYKVSVKCCPGNHDITHGGAFYSFVKKVDDPDISLNQLKSSYNFMLEDTRFIFVNSCAGNQHDVGRIDYDDLEHQVDLLSREQDKILVLHHTIMSMDEEDAQSIRNAARLVQIIQRYNIKGILHGHIHGREILRLGKDQCKVIGTGALFSRGNTNVNSQFNIIRCDRGLITKVQNYRWNADGGNDPWTCSDLEKMSYENSFEGKGFEEVYKRLLRKLEVETPLYNVRLQIENDYKQFDKDLHRYLQGDGSKIGGLDPFVLAKMWEDREVPDELYFNHGSYFCVDGKDGVDFVKEQLNKKPTSNRIILSTYNMKDVVGSLDDRAYLPSLESIQFGKNEKGDELLVHMHLRALEAERFLKINICEIAYLLERLREGGAPVVFDKVRITISAFRVQRRERFNCFLKAKIDSLSNSTLNAKVNYGKIEEICGLLEEKRECSETITNVKGIETIFEAMQASNVEAEKRIYSDEIIKALEAVLKVYKELDDLHKQGSVRTEKEKQCEKRIDRSLKDLIEKLKELTEKKEA